VPLLEFQLEQIFQNLVGNAIRYRSGRPPEIHVGAEETEEGWVFSVQDNGIGIESKYREQIFGLFKRLHTANEYPGTGMGLAICQRIIERAGGRIWVDSEPGRGTTFYFKIPGTEGRGDGSEGQLLHSSDRGQSG
jgi:chemotaxis family two-component system sensor kinase Cph1